MTRVALQVAVGAVLVFGGWVMGNAQTKQVGLPAFELGVVTENGSTTVVCLRNCWLDSSLPAQPDKMSRTLTYRACADPTQQCVSPRIGGWMGEEKPMRSIGPMLIPPAHSK